MISSKFYRLVIVLVEVSACVLSSYHVSFDSHYSVYYILYILDLIHLVKIILSFYTPYEDKRGDLITDFAKIRKRYSIFSYSEFKCAYTVVLNTSNLLKLASQALNLCQHSANLI